MRKLPGPVPAPEIPHHLQAAYDQAWQAVCSERPALLLLPVPNHLSSALAIAIKAAADAGTSSNEELVAAALMVLPARTESNHPGLHQKRVTPARPQSHVVLLFSDERAH